MEEVECFYSKGVTLLFEKALAKYWIVTQFGKAIIQYGA